MIALASLDAVNLQTLESTWQFLLNTVLEILLGVTLTPYIIK